MSNAPDYAALVRLFPVLRNLVDACGEVTLTAEEAAQIRLLGFPAEEGRWRVLPVPNELVRDNPLLENLSIGWDPRKSPGQITVANERRQRSSSAVPHTPARTSDDHPHLIDGGTTWQDPLQEELAELQSKILWATEKVGGRILKRQLQKKFWRFRAEAFGTALSDLIRGGTLRLEVNWVVACSTHLQSGLKGPNPCSTASQRTTKACTPVRE
jgi:hypothetical protein